MSVIIQWDGHRSSPAQRLEMVADRGSTLHPAAAERQEEDYQNSKKRTHPINIWGI